MCKGGKEALIFHLICISKCLYQKSEALTYITVVTNPPIQALTLVVDTIEVRHTPAILTGVTNTRTVTFLYHYLLHLFQPLHYYSEGVIISTRSDRGGHTSDAGFYLTGIYKTIGLYV